MNEWQAKIGRIAMVAATVVACWMPQLAAGEGFELQQFHPMPDQYENFFSTASADVPEHRVWSGWFVLNYGNSPLVLRNDQGERVHNVVSHQNTGHLLLSLGLMDRLELGLDVPLVLFQSGAGANELPDVGVSPEDGSFGLADLRWTAKGQLFSTRGDGNEDGVALALLTDMHLPTGNSDRLQGGDFRIGPRVAFDVIFEGVKVGANVGYRYRSATRVGNLDVRDTLNWKLGVEIPFSDEFRGTAEFFGQFTPEAEETSRVESPTELLLGGKYQHDELFFVGGAGGAVVNGYGAPDFRAFFGAGWSPARAVPPAPEPEPEPDCHEATVETDCGAPPPTECVDATLITYSMACEEGECVTHQSETPCEADEECGTVDGEPACVPEPECRVDTDCDDVPPTVCEDGFLTTYDGRCVEGECVYEATDVICMEDEECGTVDGEPACVPIPERVDVDEEEERIEIDDRIHFALDSADIKERSHDLLDEIAHVLDTNPHLQYVRIEGHTDDIGERDYNMHLSQQRAESVRQYLIGRGIDSDRLGAVGKGPDAPIADNDTPQGREMNRRVEFHIETRDE